MAKKPTKTPQDAPWRNRIVGEGDEAPDQLLANPANWRVHPYTQQQSLSAALDEVGFVQRVIVNRRLGKEWPAGERVVETLVDGHLRVAVAISKGQPTIPVTYVDLTPAEEAKVLATLDPLAAMAVADSEKLDALLREVETGSEALSAMLEDLAKESGVVPPEDVPSAESQLSDALEYKILVSCDGEQQQAKLLSKFEKDGLSCKAMII